MVPEQLTPILHPVYSATFGGALAVLLLVETLVPLDPFDSDGERARHVLRNFALWVLALLLADGFVGAWLLHIPDRLYETPSGSLFGMSMPFLPWLTIGILIIDFGQYVFHRLVHLQRSLWLVHAVHHSDDRLDVSTALRFHPAEIAIGLVWKMGLLAFCGLPLWLIAVRSILLTPVVMVQHANVRVPRSVDRPLRWIFVTPGLHKIHHSPLANENNTNFGEIFSFWDRLFGTLCDSSRAKPDAYGLPLLRDDRWQTVGGMFATPVTARHVATL
jgi:sterol desaturase/sphingolipid hydroxylase (fatty acid hydroxylase superfamily)